MSASHGGVSAAQAVEEAIRVAQDAVKADEECDFAAAVALYSRSVELIKLGLQHQRRGFCTKRRWSMATLAPAVGEVLG